MSASVPKSSLVLCAYLQIRPTSIVNSFDQTGIGNTDGVGTETNDIAVLFVKFPLGLNMSLPIVI